LHNKTDQQEPSPDRLCEAGLLPEWDTENPDAIGKAIEAILARLTDPRNAVSG
jgi:hypothetical protein